MASSYTGKSIPEPEYEPIDPSRVSSDAIDTLQAGQGARLTTRQNASSAAENARANAQKRHETKRLTGKNKPRYATKRNDTTSINRNQIIILALAVLAIILVLSFLISRAISSISALQEATQEQATQTEETEIQVDQGSTMSVMYDDATVTVEKQGDGSYAIMATGADAANPVTLFKIEGEPAALLLSGRTFIVPENLSDGWDVVSFTWGADAPASKLTDSEGTIVTGTGSVESAVLDGSIVRITDSSGAVVDIQFE